MWSRAAAWRSRASPSPSSDGAVGSAEPERRAFARALKEPFRRIAGAAGCEPSIALETLREAPADIGFDAREGAFRPYREAGVIDATRVTATALTNAAVTAGQLLSTGCAVALARRPDAI